jgi:polo-like kinase 1
MDPNNAGTEGGDHVAIIEERISKVNGDFAVKKYAKGKLLGKGGFAKCFEVTNLDTKRTLAAKIIVKASLTKSRARQKLISEIKIHKSLRHTNIVGFEHVFEDQEVLEPNKLKTNGTTSLQVSLLEWLELMTLHH